MYIKSLSLFEMLKSIALLKEQLILREKYFPTTHLSDCFNKSTTTGAVDIEMVPI